MEFLSSCYWQQEENTSALLLQELTCNGTAIFFVCVCAGGEGQDMAAAYLSGQLREWFRGLALTRAVRNTGRFLKQSAAELEHLVNRTDAELGAAGVLREQRESDGENLVSTPGFAGMLGIGQECLLFTRGEAGIYLLNRNMGRPCVECVSDGTSDGILDRISDSTSADRMSHEPSHGFLYGTPLWMQRAALESGLGLLFATDSFVKNISEEVLREGLSACEVRTERQAEKHLQELGEAAETAGGRNLAAVLVFTKEGV